MAYGSKACIADGTFKKGDIGFLVLRDGDDTDEMAISSTPWMTNQSGEPRLSGWLGNTQNVSSSAYGLGRVVAVDDNSQTVRVVRVVDRKVPAALAELGYPELAS